MPSMDFVGNANTLAFSALIQEHAFPAYLATSTKEVVYIPVLPLLSSTLPLPYAKAVHLTVPNVPRQSAYHAPQEF